MVGGKILAELPKTAEKLAIKIATIKKAIKEADNLFRFPEEGGLGIEKIRKLFGRDIKNTSDFLDKAEDINNPIYNFIKTN